MHVEPLRNPGSIALRRGIDPDFEVFAMNHYSTYINLVRAHDKIQVKCDDLAFAEEIWAHLQRAVELAIKEGEAFERIVVDAARKKPRVDTTNLHKLQSSIGEYRNILHDPIQASIKNADGIGLIPRRDTLEKYRRWTSPSCMTATMRDFFRQILNYSQISPVYARFCRASGAILSENLERFWRTRDISKTRLGERFVDLRRRSHIWRYLFYNFYNFYNFVPGSGRNSGALAER